MAGTADNTEILEDEELAEEQCDRLTLTELTAGCDRSSPSEMPGAAELAAAIMRQVELIAMRHSRIDDALKAVAFDWDWCERDLSTENETASQLLEEAGELLDELRGALFRYLGCVGRSSLVQLDSVAMAAVGEIVKCRQPWRRWALGVVAADCVRYVSGNPDAIKAVEAADDRRMEALHAKEAVDEETARPAGDAEPGRLLNTDEGIVVGDAGDDNGRGAGATKQADIDAIVSRLRGGQAGFVRALRSDLMDPNARWSKYFTNSDDESEPDHAEAAAERGDECGEADDGSDDIFAVVVFVGPEDGQPQDTLTAGLSPDRYEALRQEVRGLVARFAAEQAKSLAAPSETESDDPAEAPVQPGRQGAKTTPANVHVDSEDDEVAATV